MIHRGIPVWDIPLPYLILYATNEDDVLEGERTRLQWALFEVFGDEKEVRKARQKRQRG